MKFTILLILLAMFQEVLNQIKTIWITRPTANGKHVVRIGEMKKARG